MKRLFEDMMMFEKHRMFSLRDAQEQDDDDFFSDLPKFDDEVAYKDEEEKDDETRPQKKWYSYSSSTTSYFNGNGERCVTSTKSFKDSTGRLKTKKERRLGDRSITESEDSKGNGTQTRTLKNVEDREIFDKEWNERFAKHRPHLRLKNSSL